MLRLTSLLGIEVRRGDGSLGRLTDLGAATQAGGQPPVETAWVRRGRRTAIEIGLEAGCELRDGTLLVAQGTLDVPNTGARLLLGRHLLDAQLIDLGNKRLVRVGDVLLSDQGDGLRLCGVEIGVRPVLRRLGLNAVAPRAGSETIDWSDLHFTSTRADTLQLSVPRSAIRHLPPERIGARPGRRFGRVMRARRHAPR